MIEVLGWVLLLVVTLYITYVFVLAIAIAWTAAGYEPPLIVANEIGKLESKLFVSHDPSKWMTDDDIQAMHKSINMSIGYRPIMSTVQDEVDTIDMRTRRFTKDEICVAFGVDPRSVEEQIDTIQQLATVKLDYNYHLPPRDSLDTIIRDLRDAINGEHLELRTLKRFADILTRLEDYRARPSA